jgi:hypothetical protein
MTASTSHELHAAAGCAKPFAVGIYEVVYAFFVMMDFKAIGGGIVSLELQTVGIADLVLSI